VHHDDRLITQIAAYWNHSIHDLEMTEQPVGSLGFFDDLDEYRFDKLRYLPQIVDFSGYRGQQLLEVGCGIGTDLLRFAKGGACVTGIDLSVQAIELAQANFSLHEAPRNRLQVQNGEALSFEDDTFDVVYAHGVLQYTADPQRMISECCRVLKPGGHAIFMVYNRFSWLQALSKVMGVGLEHADAPILRLFSIRQFRRMLNSFPEATIVPERFPVRSRLHKGWKGLLYNEIFVKAFTVVPHVIVRPLGWHLMAFCRK
tara:strand:- start:805 stop:1578 length:774 start_codon:yes stop_codon:yes gene_type:complete